MLLPTHRCKSNNLCPVLPVLRREPADHRQETIFVEEVSLDNMFDIAGRVQGRGTLPLTGTTKDGSLKMR